MKRTLSPRFSPASLAACGGAPRVVSRAGDTPPAVELLNVSYDPTRELWRDINADFTAFMRRQTETSCHIKQSHGGSSTQARAVIDGLEADVVTLASHPRHRRHQQERADQRRAGQSGLPQYSRCPIPPRSFSSSGREIPKASRIGPIWSSPALRSSRRTRRRRAMATLSFFAAWGSVVLRGGSRPSEAIDYMTKLYKQVPVLDSGARGATTTFVQRKIGDVHLAWENEAHLEVQEAKGELESSIRRSASGPNLTSPSSTRSWTGRRPARPPRRTLNFLYTDAAQEILPSIITARSNQAILEKNAATFPDIKLFAITEIAKDFAGRPQAVHRRRRRIRQIYKPK